MARFAYDVNTTQRYIDVHKQFQGGLKTVDTDDALGAVFLREAENVSISEFGFLEKRYGTFENFKQTFSGNLQGYWEFEGYKIFAIDGKIFVEERGLSQVNSFSKEPGLRYPQILPFSIIFSVDNLLFIETTGPGPFQTERDMNAVNINRVLYIFTGTYPIYAKVEQGQLKFYLFPVTFPNINEIIVTGHNLLEDNYEELYFTGSDTLPNNGPINPIENPDSDVLKIKENNIVPRFPFAKDGNINFDFAYDYSENLTIPFVLDSVNQPESILNEISLDSVAFRNSGPGASSLDFTNLNDRFYTSNMLNNIFEDVAENIDLISSDGIAENFENESVPVETTTTFEVPVAYWQSQLKFTTDNTNTSKASKVYRNAEKFLTVVAKDITVDVDDVEPFETSATGSKFAFYIKRDNGLLLDVEKQNSEIRNNLSSLFAIDERNASNPLNYVSKVYRRIIEGNDVIVYELWYEAGLPFKPAPPFASRLLLYRFVVSDEAMLPEQVNEIGFSRLDFDFLSGEIFISIFDEAGIIISQGNTNVIKVRFRENGNLKDFKTFDVLRAYPLNESDRATLSSLLLKPVTRLRLFNRINSIDDVLLKTYTLGIDLEYRDGYYIFELPEGLPPDNFNHYALVFSTTEFSAIVNSSKQDAYFRQTLDTPDTFNFFTNDVKFLSIRGIDRTNITKLFYPNIDQFLRFIKRISKITPLTFTISSVTNTVDLQREGEIGHTYLNVNIFDNIISGTYDFLFNFKVNKSRLNYENFSKVEVEEPEIYSYILKDVTITAEQLQDFPRKDEDSIGIEYPTLKPIWTCNKVTEHFGKLMVWGSTAMPTAVFYSFPDRPSYFPSKFFLDFTNDQNSPVEAVSSYMNILVVLTRDQTFGVRGNSGLLTAPAPYAPFTINPTVGTIAYKSVRSVRNHLFFLSKQGIIALKSLYAADEQYNIEFVDRNIVNIVPRDDDRAVGIQFDNQYWLNFPQQRITLRWYIDKKAWVQDKYTAWHEFNGVFKYQIADGKLEFITYPSTFTSGENLGVYKVGVDYSLPTDLGGDVVALFETAFLNQNYPFHPKNYKETKMDFTIQNEYNSGREPVYSMETNQDIHQNESLHTIPAPKLLKNHRYQLKYDFENLTVELLDLGAFVPIQGGLFTDILTETLDGGLFIQVFTSFLDLGTFVQIYIDGGSFTETASQTIDAGLFERILSIQIGSFLIPITFTDISTLEFLLDNRDIPVGTDLVVTGDFENYEGGANLLDITYDHVLDFRTWIISEDNTLNLDNLEGYDQAKALIPIQMGAKFGDWVFGLSDLGNKVTAIKTIKLAGRGYNVKVYFEDYSKSKWTLESLGITYKMKRPRSR